MNELSIIFNKMEIDAESVLEAASTKWNFLPFKRTCWRTFSGVDPYYLTHKSKALGYNPEIILAGRKLNDNMPEYITKVLTEKLNERKVKLEKSNILILGLAFKENCPDVRNTKVVDLVLNLLRQGWVHIYDPLIDLKSISEHLIKYCFFAKDGLL